MTFKIPIEIIDQQKYFGHREVGLTHPDLFSFIRLTDTGEIHLMVDDGVGIIINKIQRTIVLMADQVKFFTKEDEGLKWNTLAFNHKATKYNEPAFTYVKENRSLYDGIDYYMDGD